MEGDVTVEVTPDERRFVVKVSMSSYHNPTYYFNGKPEVYTDSTIGMIVIETPDRSVFLAKNSVINIDVNVMEETNDAQSS